MTLQIAVSRVESVVRVQLVGDLDLATADQLEREVVRLSETLQFGDTLVIDVQEMTFCDSSGLHAIVRARRLAAGRDAAFRLEHPNAVTRQVLALSDLNDLIGG